MTNSDAVLRDRLFHRMLSLRFVDGLKEWLCRYPLALTADCKNMYRVRHKKVTP